MWLSDKWQPNSIPARLGFHSDHEEEGEFDVLFYTWGPIRLRHVRLGEI